MYAEYKSFAGYFYSNFGRSFGRHSEGKVNRSRWLSGEEGETGVGGRVQGEGEADSPLSREPDVEHDPGIRDHDLSRRQMLNGVSHPGSLHCTLLSNKIKCVFFLFVCV